MTGSPPMVIAVIAVTGGGVSQSLTTALGKTGPALYSH
jgi:hypothetical protein